MASETPTKRDLETALIRKCWKEPDFRKEVLTDPKGVLERQTGYRLPAGLKIVVHEEDDNTLHFSIPAAPGGVAELSDRDLERVAGGTEVVASVIITMVTLTVGTAGLCAGTLAAGGQDPW